MPTLPRALEGLLERDVTRNLKTVAVRILEWLPHILGAA